MIGEAFDDPGGWQAVGMTASWTVPLVALSVVGVRRPEAGAVFVGATGLVVLFSVVDSVVGIVSRDTGPVAAIAVFALGVALGFLALHRAKFAGLLMVAAGLVQLLVSDGRLGGSSGAMAVPVFLLGLLFLLAGALAHESLRAWSDAPGDTEPSSVPTHQAGRSRAPSGHS